MVSPAPSQSNSHTFPRPAKLITLSRRSPGVQHPSCLRHQAMGVGLQTPTRRSSSLNEWSPLHDALMIQDFLALVLGEVPTSLHKGLGITGAPAPESMPLRRAPRVRKDGLNSCGVRAIDDIELVVTQGIEEVGSDRLGRLPLSSRACSLSSVMTVQRSRLGRLGNVWTAIP